MIRSFKPISHLKLCRKTIFSVTSCDNFPRFGNAPFFRPFHIVVLFHNVFFFPPPSTTSARVTELFHRQFTLHFGYRSVSRAVLKLDKNYHRRRGTREKLGGQKGSLWTDSQEPRFAVNGHNLLFSTFQSADSPFIGPLFSFLSIGEPVMDDESRCQDS